MNNTESIIEKSVRISPTPLVKKEHGLFNCSTMNCSVQDVYAFCQSAENVEKILTDLPINIENFLNLQLIGSEHNNSGVYEVKWENKPDSKAKGILTFTFKSAPLNRGTMLMAEAVFDHFKINDEEPSMLMNIFLRRMKAFLETGEIPTTKGQPSGREEIKEKEQTKLH